MLDGQKKSALVDMKSINQVPVTFWVAGKDKECPKKFNKKIYKQIQSEGKVWYEQKDAEHDFFGWIRGDTFTQKMIAAIETGDPDAPIPYPHDFYSAEMDAFYGAAFV